jgi:Abortive infection alpha
MADIPDPLNIRDRSAALAKLGIDSLSGAERQARNLLHGAAGERAARSEEPQDRARSGAKGPAPSQPGRARSLHQKLGRLLTRALEQSTAEARSVLYERILDELVPDEAWILSALSDGSTYPLLHIYARGRSGRAGPLLLANASVVGKSANVTLPHLTPVYVTNLLHLGLAELGPEDPSLKDDYQILLADPEVLRTLKAGSIGPLPPPTERHVLRISQLGRDLWAAAAEEDR